MVLALAGVVLLLAACEGNGLDLPAAEVGRSPHFRYYARAADRVPATVLDLLEAHWLEMSTFFHLDQRLLVNYYLFDSRDDFVTHGPCPSFDGGCARGASVYSERPFHEHELIHAYFSTLGAAPPILAEGVASGLSCFEFLSGPEAPPDNPSWQAAASGVHIDSTDYGQKRLVRYLIRQYGAEAFARFYQYAEHTLDPAIFALQFDRFWDQSIDSAWAAATTVQHDPTYLDTAMCPCSEATSPVDGGSVSVPTPYATFSLPRPFTLAAESDLVVSLGGLGGTAIRNCWDENYQNQLLQEDLPGVPPAATAFLRLPAGHYYLQSLPLGASPASISIQPGGWFAADCVAGETFAVDSAFVGNMEILAPAAPSYLHIAVAGPRTVTVSANSSNLSLCPDCSSSAAGCVTAAALSPVTVTLDGAYVVNLDAGQRAALAFQ